MQGVIREMPWYGDSEAGIALADRACKPNESPVSAWELNTALEAMDLMLSPLLEEEGVCTGWRSLIRQK